MRLNWARPRPVIAVNSSIARGFWQGQLQYFQNSGFDVTVLGTFSFLSTEQITGPRLPQISW